LWRHLSCLCANNPTHFALLEAAELSFAHHHYHADNHASSSFQLAMDDNNGDNKGDRLPVEVEVVVSLGCGQPAAAAIKDSSSSSTSMLGLGGYFGGLAANLGAAQDLMAGLFNLMTDTDMTHEVG
jgi:hypothetical protein